MSPSAPERLSASNPIRTKAMGLMERPGAGEDGLVSGEVRRWTSLLGRMPFGALPGFHGATRGRVCCHSSSGIFHNLNLPVTHGIIKYFVP